jgi:glycosyltransferase involved in cell wall biosynthesis
MSYLATVVIPSYGREQSVKRAVQSILNQNGSDRVEIIVVDDFYPKPLLIDNLRSNDTLIRTEANVGGAKARNIGMSIAKGAWIFLLDSDDYFVKVDFSLIESLDEKYVYYSNIQGKDFPSAISIRNFFDYVFVKHISIAQTSSLFFSSKLDLKFDESLPKHQDWDFIYFQAMQNNIELKKSDFLVYQDKSDKNSLSRKVNFAASLPFYSKLLTSGVNRDDLDVFDFLFFYPNVQEKSWVEFAKLSFSLFKRKRINMYTFLKVTYKRFVIKK